MRSSTGKTLRYVPRRSCNDASFVVASNNKCTNLDGFEFHKNVTYSLNKKQRWQLMEKFSKKLEDEEDPIIYVKHQCVFNEEPMLDLYLYDSISKTEIGSFEVSNRHLQSGKFNSLSAIHQIENRNDYTEREKRHHKKESMKKLKMGIAPNNEDLPVKEEFLTEKKLREDCVTVHEYVNVQDLSMVNWTHLYNYKCSRDSRTRNKRVSKDFSDDECEDFSDHDNFDTRFEARPFIISGKDFRCPEKFDLPRVRRTRKKKRIYSTVAASSAKIESENAVEEAFEGHQEDANVIMDRILPEMVVNTPRDKFTEDLRSIIGFCKCWRSLVGQSAVLIDLDEFEPSIEKSFIILRPSVQTDEDRISIRVIFNVTHEGFNLDETLAVGSEGVAAVVAFVQSRLRPGECVGSPSANLLSLSGSVNHVNHLPEAQPIDNTSSLHIYHKEWTSCLLTNDNVDDLIDGMEHFNFAMEVCDLCGNEVADHEMVVIKDCQHKMCEACLVPSIVDQVSRNTEVVTCSYPGCSVDLDAPTILSFVSWRLYLGRRDMLTKMVMKAAGQPCTQCKSMLVAPGSVLGNRSYFNYVCTCGHSVCFDCGQLSHWPTSCLQMREHSHRLQRPPYEAPTLARPSYRFTKCHSCNERICLTQVVDQFECVCGTAFCKNCVPAFKLHSSSCQDDTEAKHTFPHTSEIVPIQKPKTPVPKLYNQSVYLHFLRRSDNMSNFKHVVSKLESMALVARSESSSAADLTAAYSQILRILESMYVAAYKSYKKDNPKKLHLLKVSTGHLLFYVRRIQMLVEEVDGLSRSGVLTTAHHIKYDHLQEHIHAARIYTDKIFSLIHV